MEESPWWVLAVVSPVMLALAFVGRWALDYMGKERERSVVATTELVTLVKAQLTEARTEREMRMSEFRDERREWALVIKEHTEASRDMVHEHKKTNAKIDSLVEALLIQNGKEAV